MEYSRSFYQFNLVLYITVKQSSRNDRNGNNILKIFLDFLWDHLSEILCNKPQFNVNIKFCEE